MKINIKTNQKAVIKSLGRRSKKHIPKATKWALNNTAKSLSKAYSAQIQKKLDNPIPFTIRGFFIGFAKPSNLEAFVQVKDDVAKYLKWQIEGGVSTPTKKYAVPTPNRKLNQYGNIPGKSKGLVKNKQEIRKTKTGFGVWSIATKSKPAKLLIAFKSSINYAKKFPFFYIGKKFIANVLPKELKKSFKKEMRR
tara:strand:- start:53 stop:634 length:582 start_codon:yes stop_codon:yes gene_type:complete